MNSSGCGARSSVIIMNINTGKDVQGSNCLMSRRFRSAFSDSDTSSSALEAGVLLGPGAQYCADNVLKQL
jgi:hypothetical protein